MKGREGKGNLIMLLMVDVATLLPRGCLIFICIKKVRQGDGEQCQGGSVVGTLVIQVQAFVRLTK